MPEGKNLDELTEDFATFFLDKITKMCENITNIDNLARIKFQNLPALHQWQIKK